MTRNLYASAQPRRHARLSSKVLSILLVTLALTQTSRADDENGLPEKEVKPFKFSKKTGDISLSDIQQIYEEDPLIDEELDKRVEEATEKMLQLTIDACVDHISDQTPNFKKKKGKKKDKFGAKLNKLKHIGELSTDRKKKKKKKHKKKRRKRNLKLAKRRSNRRKRGQFEISVDMAKQSITERANLEDKEGNANTNNGEITYDQVEGAPVEVLRRFEPNAQVERELIMKERRLKLQTSGKIQGNRRKAEEGLRKANLSSPDHLDHQNTNSTTTNDQNQAQTPTHIQSNSTNQIVQTTPKQTRKLVIDTPNPSSKDSNNSQLNPSQANTSPQSLKISTVNRQKINSAFKDRSLKMWKKNRHRIMTKHRRRALKLKQQYQQSAYESQPSPKKKHQKHKKSRTLRTHHRKLKHSHSPRKMKVSVSKSTIHKRRKRHHKRHRKKRKLFGLPGGGGGSVVVAPNQGAGIANAQVVVNSLGTPATIPYAEGNAVPAYAPEDTAPKVIVTRMKMPSNVPYLV